MPRKITSYGLLILLILSMALFRVFIGSYSEHKKGMLYMAENKPERAAIHFERSIRWYTPVNRFVADSISRLYGIAELYEREGRIPDATGTFEILRSAILSVRSFYTPYGDVVKKCEEKIASLRVASGGDEGSSANRKKFSRDEILKSLRKDEAPSVFYSFLAIAGFAGWIASALYFILRVLSREVFPKRRAAITGVAFFAFYIIWLFALYKA